MNRILTCDLRIDKSALRPIFLKKGTVLDVQMIDRFEPFCFVKWFDEDGKCREDRHFPRQYLFECTRKLHGIDINTPTVQRYVDSQIESVRQDTADDIKEATDIFSKGQKRKLLWYVLGMILCYHIVCSIVSAICKAVGI